MDSKERIRKLNDLFRETGIGGISVITQGVQKLEDEKRHQLYSLVRRFNQFSEENDPHDQHDFGAVKFEGEMYFWKIDYYDESLRFGSEDPANADKTTRVLTLMQSCEY